MLITSHSLRTVCTNVHNTVLVLCNVITENCILYEFSGFRRDVDEVYPPHRVVTHCFWVVLYRITNIDKVTVKHMGRVA
jgi:hypothetical protein